MQNLTQSSSTHVLVFVAAVTQIRSDVIFNAFFSPHDRESALTERSKTARMGVRSLRLYESLWLFKDESYGPEGAEEDD